LRSAVDDILRGSEVARRIAAQRLVSLGIAAEPILVACMRAAAPEVIGICLECLVEIGSKKPAQLLPPLVDAADPALRLIALRIGQGLKEEERKPLLQKALHDPDPAIRRRALTYLGWHSSDWAKAEIIGLCYESESTVKWAALEILAALDPDAARERLASIFPKMESVLRRRAVRLLERQQKRPE
jgi:HEAT repeat protein